MNRCNIGVPTVHFDTSGENFTFIPKRTVLDYILFDKYSISKLTMYKVFTEGSMSITSDHLPVFAELEINCIQHFLNHQKLQLPAWHRATTDDIERYKTSLDTETTTLLDRDLTSFPEVNTFFNEIIRVLTNSATSTIPHCGCNPYTRPGWTKEVKDLHTNERRLRRNWISENRPRGMDHESYRNY